MPPAAVVIIVTVPAVAPTRAVVVPAVAVVPAVVAPVVVVTAAPTSGPSVAVVPRPPVTHAARHVLYSDLALIQLAPVGGLLGANGLVDGLELDKGVVALHVDAHEFAVGLKEHLEVLPLGGLLVKVDNKEGLIRGNILAAFILLSLDAAVATGEFRAEAVGDLADVHSADFGDIVLDAFLLLQGGGILEEDEAVAAFHVHPVHGDGRLDLPVVHAPRRGVLEDVLHVARQAVVAEVAEEAGTEVQIPPDAATAAPTCRAPRGQAALLRV